MIFQLWSWWLPLVFGLITCSSKVEGLKCYICNIETDGEGCMVSVSSRKSEFLKECHPSAETCATFTVEPNNAELPPFRRWFQRTCIYPSDRPWEAFALINKLPGQKGVFMDHYHGFSYLLPNVNKIRKDNSLPLIQGPSETFLQSFGWIQTTFLQTCAEGWASQVDFTTTEDGCNSWDGKPIYPLAEDFPFDDHKDRIALVDFMKCYSCSTRTGKFPYSEYAHCRETQTFTESAYKRMFWSDIYGCATLSIYQIAGGSPPYFEKNAWLPGDSWCLEKRFASSPLARSLVQYMNKKGNKTGGRSGEESCREGYARALKKRNSKGRTAEPFSDEENYIWAGKREFVSIEEFSDFLKCRNQVRKRLNVYSSGNLDGEFKFNEDEAKTAFAGKSGPFASVGFHFCGPYDYCNDWSEEHLQEVLENPPPKKEMGTRPPRTTTPPPPPTTSTNSTTTSPTPTTAPIPEANKTSGVSIKEIPEGCEIKGKNSGEMLDSVTLEGILSILVIEQAMKYLFMK